MNNVAIRGFYLLTEKIKDLLLENPNVNTVTYGDISKIDLNKQTIFPLSHTIVNSVVSSERTLTINMSILSMDIVNISKDETQDVFLGTTNEQDVLNTQMSVINTLVQKLRISNIHNDGYQILSDVTLEPFVDRFENMLAGWTGTFDVVIQNDINVC
jgi:hypothetical protein